MSIRLASLFQDHAVLQRGHPLPVWGWAEPSREVHLSLGGHRARTLASERGDFLARLPAVEEKGPHTLIVEVPGTGERLEVRDLVAGEVWLASGQSNMEWTLANSRPLTGEDIATADFPDIRFFNVAKRAHLGPHREVDGCWQPATPETAENFSAVAFSFARRLHRELGVPVGIIASAWGGSIIEAWLSRSALAHNPDVSGWLGEYETEAWSEKKWSGHGMPDEHGLPLDPGNDGLARGWNEANFDDSAWPALDIPASWQAAGHRHSGVFWFRRRLEIPESWRGRDLELHLGAADKHDITYANGVEIGRTGTDIEEQHWNVPRVYAIPAAAVESSSLQLAVRVHSFVFQGGLIGPANAMRVHPGGEPGAAISLAGSWRYACERDFGLVTPKRPMGHGEHNSPHMLYDNMIQPLAPYALRGAIWYQGESNTDAFGPYAGLLRDLIRDWRRTWGDPSLAFHLVQLPNYHQPSVHQADSHWARLREAQREALSEPHTGMVMTIDLGETGDIHPKNKVPVGERLAGSVLVREYDFEGPPCGPLFSGWQVEGSQARCHFEHCGGRLITTDGLPPATFHLAGPDQIFHPAEARIEGTEVFARCGAVPQPVAIRYAWADNPLEANLAGVTGLPAGPFRSDDWPYRGKTCSCAPGESTPWPPPG